MEIYPEADPVQADGTSVPESPNDSRLIQRKYKRLIEERERNYQGSQSFDEQRLKLKRKKDPNKDYELLIENRQRNFRHHK